MSGWTVSAIFQQAMINPLLQAAWTTAKPTTYGSLSADAINVALFNNSVTPDKTAAAASTGYNTGVWITADEVTGSGIWAAGGRPLGTKTFAIDTGSSSVCFTAANLAGAGSGTLTNAYGCLVYDNTITGGTVAAQGLCFNYFGGPQTVTGGTFTINWATPVSAIVTAVFNVSV